MNTYHCPVCGKEFKEFPSQVNKTGCCSRKCSSQIPKPRRPISERFWEKVQKADPDDCWEWKAHRSPQGYGTFRHGNYCTRAHRVAWQLTFGEIPKGKPVLHHCDNPPCCNPAHLWTGTIGDNNRDRHAKGRTARGSKMPRSRLTADAVKSIRDIYLKAKEFPERNPNHITYRELGDRYGVGQHAIRSVVIRRTWTHI